MDSLHFLLMHRQCSFKTINAYIYQKRIRKIFDMITYKQTESENDAEIHEMYLKWAKRLSVLLKLLFYTLTLNIIFFSLYAFLGIVLGSPQFIFVLNIPGFNTDPKAGFPDYEIQLLYQLGALVIGVYEVIALDGLIAYFILSGVSMGDSIIVTIQRMSTAVLDERTSSEDTAEAIKRIIQLHWEYLSYINNLDEMYNGMFLMQFGSFAFSGSVAMYAGRSVSILVSRDFVVLLCRIIDLDPLIRDRRRTILFYACFIYPFFFHSFTLYTLYYHRNNIIPFLQCVSIWGAAGQVWRPFIHKLAQYMGASPTQVVHLRPQSCRRKKLNRDLS
uniref:Putative membrane protein n=1 Tax=Lutzomyia longipalpis TaxID=7200 RepID=A0A7G3AMD3_LUTLO